ncbi:MAG: ATP-dependent DNA helicase [Candidatus Paceibacterota bacterium]|jgi:DNA helicase-2/ATP-dependent DNA helicase PcrA
MQDLEKNFEIEYGKLNKEQKEAVDTIDGPVMVVAGPGTGKTQILALRIGNILLKTDIKADSILCLTFTNSGVKAMKNRLNEYIGLDAEKVHISTFHGFGIELIENNYNLLGFTMVPKLLSDDEAVFLVDDILQRNVWEYLRPRANPEMYFSDLKQLISILKREGLKPEEFLSYIEFDIKFLKNDEGSISTRGESKGQLKKEIKTKIESLERTREVVEFYRIYEEKKIEAGFMDYDDILEYTVKLVEEFPDIRAEIKENYQYVLVDEHQDSSGVQNNFLKAVWKEVEMPNIFVVGDDRQLIYGFSGAKLSYFEEFAHFFGKAKKIILIENYRSTEDILDLADDLLQSPMASQKLKSNTKIKNKNNLNEYAYPRDEILGAGLYFKDKIKEGMSPLDCVLLVPKNYQVRNAIDILRNINVPVSAGKNLSLFNIIETQSFLRVLNIVADPFNSIYLAESLLDKYTNIPTFSAHKFLKIVKANQLSIEDLISHKKTGGLFSDVSDEENSISKWGSLLKKWIDTLSGEKLSVVVSVVGNEFLINRSKKHEELIRNVEVVRSFIHLALLFEEKHKNKKLPIFLEYLKRLESYSSHISLASFGSENGVQVMTLHKSKGLEYKVVWIAHMNEEVIMSEKRNSFSLPEKVKMHIKERDIESTKRELYVAITRAKEFCNISYASENYTGGEMELAQIIRELPEEHFIKKSKEETEKEILYNGPQIYTALMKNPSISRGQEEGSLLEDIKKFVKENYEESRISVSLLNNFFECPWKWYFRNFLKLPEVKSTSLALGSAVHSTIEFILKNKALPKEDEMKEKIKIELQKEGKEDGPELIKLSKDAFSAVSFWINNYYENLEKDYTSERSLSFRDPKFPQLLMYGKLDLTERLQNGDLIVTDFKTGSPKTKSAIEKINEEGRPSSLMRQLAMYSYLISGAEKGREVSVSKLLFLEASKDDKNALYSTHIDKEKIELLLKDITDYNNLLKIGDWVNRPCNYNSYGKATVCEYCKIAEIYKS